MLVFTRNPLLKLQMAVELCVCVCFVLAVVCSCMLAALFLLAVCVCVCVCVCEHRHNAEPARQSEVWLRAFPLLHTEHTFSCMHSCKHSCIHTCTLDTHNIFLHALLHTLHAHARSLKHHADLSG